MLLRTVDDNSPIRLGSPHNKTPDKHTLPHMRLAPHVDEAGFSVRGCVGFILRSNLQQLLSGEQMGWVFGIMVKA